MIPALHRIRIVLVADQNFARFSHPHLSKHFTKISKDASNQLIKGFKVFFLPQISDFHQIHSSFVHNPKTLLRRFSSGYQRIPHDVGSCLPASRWDGAKKRGRGNPLPRVGFKLRRDQVRPAKTTRSIPPRSERTSAGCQRPEASRSAATSCDCPMPTSMASMPSGCR